MIEYRVPQPFGQLRVGLIVHQIVKRLQHQHVEYQHFIPLLASGGTFARTPSPREPPRSLPSDAAWHQAPRRPVMNLKTLADPLYVPADAPVKPNRFWDAGESVFLEAASNELIY